MMIREAQISDIPQLRTLGAITWQATYQDIFPPDLIENVLREWWSEANFQQAFASPDICNLLAETDGQIVGTLMGSLKPQADGELHLFRLYIHPDYQGQGIGRQLWQGYVAAFPPGVQRVDLEVEPQNTRAIQFYKRLAFEAGELITNEVFGYAMKSLKMHLWL